MSDLELAKSKLIDTIGHYNSTASDIQKFKFNQLETNVLASIMVEFAKELANEDSKETEKALAINGVVKSLPIDRENVLKVREDIIKEHYIDDPNKSAFGFGFITCYDWLAKLCAK